MAYRATGWETHFFEQFENCKSVGHFSFPYSVVTTSLT